jgi:nucleoside 2-deoxyribosyltransferase
MGCHVYSPIWATHRAAILYQLPKDHLFWLAFNKAFLDPAVGVLVADIDGWKTSKGTQQEIAYARATGKPVYLINDNNGLGPVTIAELPEAVA